MEHCVLYLFIECRFCECIIPIDVILRYFLLLHHLTDNLTVLSLSGLLDRGYETHSLDVKGYLFMFRL